MKKTALFDRHISLGAKMVSFAGFQMPIQYSSITAEHLAVRTNAGIFDVSHMGQFLLEGVESIDLLQKVTTNDINTLEDGKAQYSCLTNENGGIVDDLIVYRINKDKYFVVVNASNIDKDWKHISKYNTRGVDMINVSDQTSLIAIQGPSAIEILQKITDTVLSDIPYYGFKIGNVADAHDVIISNTGYTGSGGFEIYLPNEQAGKIWDILLDKGEPFGMLPCGLAARDTLRLEKGFCLYGNDIDDSTSPLEAGLGWITKFNKNFISKEILLKQKEEGLTRKLVGFEMQEKAIPRHGYQVVNSLGEDIGKVTSGTMSPMKNIGIGLAYISKPYFKVGADVFIRIRNKNVHARVVKLPFF